MKKHNRFIILIIIAIFIYLIGIFSYNQFFNKKEANVKNINNVKKLENLNQKIKLDENIVENKDEQIKKDEIINNEDNNKIEIDNTIKYVSKKIKAYNNENKEKVVANIPTSTKIKILETKNIEKIIKLKDGTTKTENIIMNKIKFIDNLKEKIAWIENVNLEDTFVKTLKNEWKKLDFSPVIKNEYTNNPRREVRGFYVTANSIAIPKRFNELLNIAKKNNINTFVIDVKEDAGTISFKVSDEVKALNPNSNNNPTIKNIEEIMQKLKENNIYTIARIVSFKDPIYAKNFKDRTIVYKENGQPFTNSDGIIWVSPYDRNLWKYNIEVAKEAARVGFNEIQFDYVRFPASNGGKLDKFLNYRNKNNETKVEAIQNYLKYARKELAPYNVYISADIYGQVASSSDDMSLGQYYETISNIVDYVSPMIYPSHYANGVYGLNVPDANPYKTVYHSTKDALQRNYNLENPALVRPWIQAFTATWVRGHINYGPQEIREQVKAMKDLGVNEYILWSPTNRYERYY